LFTSSVLLNLLFTIYILSNSANGGSFLELLWCVPFRCFALTKTLFLSWMDEIVSSTHNVQCAERCLRRASFRDTCMMGEIYYVLSLYYI
jgi:hypothetical protein